MIKLNKLKNKISIILVMQIITILILFTTKANATNAMTTSIQAPSSAKIGETITVSLNISGSEEGVKGFQAKLAYDKNTLELINKQCEKDGWSITGYNDGTGILLAEISDVSSTNYAIKNKTTLVSFSFKVKSNASVGDTKISVSEIVASGATNLSNTEASTNIKITSVENADNKESNNEKENSSSKANTSDDGTNKNQSNNSVSNVNKTSGVVENKKNEQYSNIITKGWNRFNSRNFNSNINSNYDCVL